MKTTLINWMDNLKKAWMEGNIEIINKICSEDITYYEDPHLQPLGKKEVIKDWTNSLKNQRNVSFDYDIIVNNNINGVVTWNVKFTRINSNKTVLMSGVFILNLNDLGQCNMFRQWWVEKPSQML